MVTGELPVLQQKTMQDKTYYMPDLGEMVVCLYTGGNRKSGVVLGSIYSSEDSPVLTGQNVKGVIFKDGAEVSYDSGTNKAVLQTSGTATCRADGGVGVFSEDDLMIDTAHVNITTGIMQMDGDTLNVNCGEVNLGMGARLGVIHEASPCPIYGVCHLGCSETTKTKA